jgi:phage recombination protein Bet
MINENDPRLGVPETDDQPTPSDELPPVQAVEVSPAPMPAEGAMMKVHETKTLTAHFADAYGIPQNQVADVVKATCFKGQAAQRATNAQMMMFLSVAKMYGLNPFMREIFAFPDKNNGITPIVGVDGFIALAMKNTRYIGHDYVYAEKLVSMPGTKDGQGKQIPEWIECHVLVRSSEGPRTVKAREYFDECYNPSAGPWNSHPRRQLRHKATIQALRLAIGLHGIYDEDEGERIANPDPLPSEAQAASVASRIGDGLAAAGIAPVQDEPAGEMVDVSPVGLQTTAEEGK